MDSRSACNSCSCLTSSALGTFGLAVKLRTRLTACARFDSLESVCSLTSRRSETGRLRCDLEAARSSDGGTRSASRKALPPERMMPNRLRRGFESSISRYAMRVTGCHTGPMPVPMPVPGTGLWWWLCKANRRTARDVTSRLTCPPAPLPCSAENPVRVCRPWSEKSPLERSPEV